MVATFLADSGVKGGQVVKLTGNGQVGPCSAGDAFCGVALEPRAGLPAVQVKGFVTVKTGKIAVAVNRVDGKVRFRIEVPEKARFVYCGAERELNAGMNEFTI